MGNVAPVGGSVTPKADPPKKKNTDVAAAAHDIAKGKVNAAVDARNAVPKARDEVQVARQGKDDADKGAVAAGKAADKPGQTPKEAKKSNEFDSAFEGTNRKAELEKLLGTVPPPPRKVAQKPEMGAPPLTPLDAVDAKDAKDAAKVPDGKTYTDPSSGAKYQVKKNATTGETLLSDVASGSSVTIKPDGSYTSTVTSKESTKSGGTRETTWTRSSDAKGEPTRLESRKSQAEQHAETGATTTTYETPCAHRRGRRRAPRRGSRSSKPRASLKPGESSLTVTEEARFNAQGEPAVSTRKTESVASQALKSDKTLEELVRKIIFGTRAGFFPRYPRSPGAALACLLHARSGGRQMTG